jgi:hypothetical protein
MNTREVLPHIIAFRCIWEKIWSKVFLTEMANAMEKAGTLGLTERLGSAIGPMVGATVSMRHAKSTPKQNNKKRRGQGHQSWRDKSTTKRRKVVALGWQNLRATDARNQRISLLSATNARLRTARNVKRNIARKVLKKDHHASAWRAFQRWRGNSIGACASNAKELARNSLLNASTARPRTATDAKKKLAKKVLKKKDHHASA